MQIPLTYAEIANGLNLPVSDIEEAARSGALARTIACPYRPHDGLSWCSIYDALEFALWHGRLSIVLSKDEAAMWILLLSEADEADGFTEASKDEKTFKLVAMAVEEGLYTEAHLHDRVAEQIIDAQQRFLMMTCHHDCLVT